jgi:hypothetical protein
VSNLMGPVAPGPARTAAHASPPPDGIEEQEDGSYSLPFVVMIFAARLSLSKKSLKAASAKSFSTVLKFRPPASVPQIGPRTCRLVRPFRAALHSCAIRGDFAKMAPRFSRQILSARSSWLGKNADMRGPDDRAHLWKRPRFHRFCPLARDCTVLARWGSKLSVWQGAWSSFICPLSSNP